MPVICETIETQGIAHLSYVLGDDKSGTAVVIDPRPDVDIYLRVARKRKLSITHIFETHIHADYMSGACELAARLGTAEIFSSVEGDAKYGFQPRPLKDGDKFTFGDLILTARHTPGHTPEHMALEAAEENRNSSPWGVFTGDSLFVNSAGRPDLVGADKADELAEALFDTLTNYYLKLADHVMIHPSHGHGSPCGADIGDRLTSTIGYEREYNPFLRYTNLKEFKAYTLSTAPPEPTYYKPMKIRNANGPEILGNLPRVPSLDLKAFRELLESREVVLIDTRHMLAFGGGHIAGARNIGAIPELSVWAGWILDPTQALLLILDDDRDVDTVVAYFVRTGFTNFSGYLAGGMKVWNNAGLPIAKLSQLPVQELKKHGDDIQIIDVRAQSEWDEGHVPNAQHLFLPELQERSSNLDKSKPLAVYCDSGYRASLAASILKRAGFDVSNVPGSWQAWKNAGYTIAK